MRISNKEQGISNDEGREKLIIDYSELGDWELGMLSPVGLSQRQADGGVRVRGQWVDSFRMDSRWPG